MQHNCYAVALANTNHHEFQTLVRNPLTDSSVACDEEIWHLKLMAFGTVLQDFVGKHSCPPLLLPRSAMFRLHEPAAAWQENKNQQH